MASLNLMDLFLDGSPRCSTLTAFVCYNFANSTTNIALAELVDQAKCIVHAVSFSFCCGSEAGHVCLTMSDRPMYALFFVLSKLRLRYSPGRQIVLRRSCHPFPRYVPL